MSKPRKIQQAGEAGYPSLEEYRCGRRRFLRKLAVGVSIGIGGSLLARCTGTSGITGIAGPVPELYTVRIPDTGVATAYLQEWDYLEYAVTFTTYDEEFASWFAARPDAAMRAMADPLSSRYCHEVQDDALRPTLLSELRAALEAHYATGTSREGTWIESLSLQVTSCQELPVMGDMEMPSYP